MKGQYQVKLGQKDKTSYFLTFFQKRAHLVQFSIKISKKKMSFILMLDNSKCQKLSFKKVTLYHLYLFFFFTIKP